jgi:hypothetical protein
LPFCVFAVLRVRHIFLDLAARLGNADDQLCLCFGIVLHSVKILNLLEHVAIRSCWRSNSYPAVEVPRMEKKKNLIESDDKKVTIRSNGK